MYKCPTCGKDIRLIASAPSMGKQGEPIPVEATAETLISESGRRITGYREHKCDESPPEARERGGE
jgi:hypothetical protein